MSDFVLRYDHQGLIPAIVQDELGQVRMLGYMNEESLRLTQDTGLCYFYSRSRQRLWQKGEQSGHVLEVLSIRADCDGDSLLILARPKGPTCHTGEESCFFHLLSEGPEPFSLAGLYRLIEERKKQPKEGSYTNYLFDKGLDKILKKLGEESTEVIIAAKGQDREETIYELADLCYHALVLMVDQGISIQDVLGELASRHVIDHKVKQEKMGGQSQA